MNISKETILSACRKLGLETQEVNDGEGGVLLLNDGEYVPVNTREIFEMLDSTETIIDEELPLPSQKMHTVIFAPEVFTNLASSDLLFAS